LEILQPCFPIFEKHFNMKNIRFILYGASVAGMLICADSGHAAVILSEDFETAFDGNPTVVGTNYTTASSNIFKQTAPVTVGLGANPGTGNTLRYSDNATAGATFTGSTFLDVSDVGSGGPAMRSAFTLDPLNQSALTDLWTVSFDFYEPNAVIAGTATHFRLVMGAGDLTNAANRTVDFLFAAANDGVAATGGANNWDALPGVALYTTNALHHFDFVGNNSVSSATYGGGDLPAQTFDVYMDGVLVLNNALFRNAISSVTDLGFGYSSTASRVDRVFIDNIVVHDVAVVAEPSTFILAGVSMIGLALIRKRRAK
jgi:hypothetical protein